MASKDCLPEYSNGKVDKNSYLNFLTSFPNLTNSFLIFAAS